jgi:hypothetical protein
MYESSLIPLPTQEPLHSTTQPTNLCMFGGGYSHQSIRFMHEMFVCMVQPPCLLPLLLSRPPLS